MKSERYKFGVLVLLIVGFVSYSLHLYMAAPRIKIIQDSELAAEGKILWQEKNCTSCHQIYGLGGHLGPDLTNVTSKQSIDYVRAFIKSGTDIMPDYGLSEHQISALVAFLTAVDKSGKSDPRTFKKHLNGTITQ